MPVTVPPPLTINVTLCPAAASLNAPRVSPLVIVTVFTLPLDTVNVGASVDPSVSIVSA